MARKLGRLAQTFTAWEHNISPDSLMKLCALHIPSSRPLVTPARAYAAKARIQAAKSSTDSPATPGPKKAPRTAYQLFQKESGPAILADKATLTLGERSKVLAEAWKQTPAEEKAKLMERIQSAKGEVAPKLPRSAYVLFLKEAGPAIAAARPEITNFAERSKAVAAEWKRLPEQERARYQEAYLKLKQAKQ